ncbi:MAG: GAF domain-containing protein [Aestuariivirga sp.]
MSSDNIIFDQAISAAQDSNAVWMALKVLSEAVAGHKLFTIMTVDNTAGLARRAYTSHERDYPVSGTKPIHHDLWFDIVHGEKRSFVANTIDDISKVFPDFELIASLGCGSVMNLPVVLQGELVATVNMLDAEYHYTPERVAAAEALLAIPAKLCYALAAQFNTRTGKPE